MSDWICDKCGDRANIATNEKLVGHGCVCGGDYKKRPSLITPLRAEPPVLRGLIYRFPVVDDTGELVCECPTKETAAAIVAMSEDAKRLGEALNEIAKWPRRN